MERIHKKLQIILLLVFALPLFAETPTQNVSPATPTTPAKADPRPSKEARSRAEADLELKRLTASLDAAFRLQKKFEIPGLLEDLKKLAPDSAQHFYFQALDSYTRGEKLKALALIKKSISKDPLLTPAYTIGGLIYADGGKDQSALPFFERAVQQSPYDPIYLLNLALCKNRLGMKADALSLLDQALRARANLAEAMYWKGVLLAENGQNAEAQKYARGAVEAGLKNVSAYRLWLQLAFEAADDVDVARAVSELSQDARESARWRLAAEYSFRFGDFRKAVSLLDRAFQMDEGMPEDRRMYVRCLFAEGQDPMPWIRSQRLSDAERQELRTLVDLLQNTPGIVQSRDPLVRPAK